MENEHVKLKCLNEWMMETPGAGQEPSADETSPSLEPVPADSDLLSAPTGDDAVSADDNLRPSTSEDSSKDQLTEQHSRDPITNEAVASCSEKPCLSLDVFPPELLQIIGLNLPASSITALKSMNTYFSDTFSADKFWKKYLHYPERFLMNDMQSGSPGLAEVVGEISSGAVGKWQGLYKLQEARLQTLSSPHINEDYHLISINEKYDFIVCLDESLLDMQDMVDNHNERWLFVVTDNYNGFGNCCFLCIWNITSTPRALNPYNLGEYSLVYKIMKILPEGKIILKEKLDRSDTYFIGVYLFENPTYEVAVLFRIACCLDICFSPSVEIPENEEYCDFDYAIGGNLCVASEKDSMHNLDEATLHIWNLRSGIKVAKICLHESAKEFTGYLKSKYNSSSNTEPTFKMLIKEGNSSSIIVVLKETSLNFCQINILDLKNLKLNVFLETCNNVGNCYMFEDKMCVVCSPTNSASEDSNMVPCLSVYSAKLPKLLKTILTDIKKHPNKVIFKDSKVLIDWGEKVDILSLDTEPVQSHQVSMPPGSLLGFVEPRLMFVLDYSKFDAGSFEQRVTVINTVDGSEIISWSVKPHLITSFKRYYNKLQYPSKVLVSKRGETGGEFLFVR